MRCAGTRDAPHPSDVHERRSPSPSQPLAKRPPARLAPALVGVRLRDAEALGGGDALGHRADVHMRVQQLLNLTNSTSYHTALGSAPQCCSAGAAERRGVSQTDKVALNEGAYGNKED